MKNLAIFKDYEKHNKGVDEGKRMMSNGVFVLAHHLKAIKDNELYKAIGDDGQGTWEAYLATKKINKNTAEKYIGLYTFYIEDMGKKPEELEEMSVDTLSKYKSALTKSEPDKRNELFETMKSEVSLSDLHKTFVDQKLAKPHWLTVKKCGKCKKYEIHYEQDAVCTCTGAGVAVYAKPIK